MAEAQEQPQEPAAAGAVEQQKSVLDEMLEVAKIPSGDPTYGAAKMALGKIIESLYKDRAKSPKINQAAADLLIAEIDEKLSRQVDEILHHQDFQKLESAWRGLKLVVDRTNFRENIKIEILSVSKEDLLQDFEDSPEVVRSGLYKRIYTENYGTFGGEPVGAIIANYEFGPGPQDIKLLRSCAAVATMAHAPFIAAAGPKFFDEKDFLRLPNLNELSSIFDKPQYTAWRSFRESEDSRYVGLTLPRFLLRLPYGSETDPVKSFNYEEGIHGRHESYLWGNTAFAFATRLADSFAKYRFCVNVVGPRYGGAVEELPVHVFEELGEKVGKIPTEVSLPERMDFQLSEHGFMPLVMRKGSDNAAFFSANSCQKVPKFPDTEEGKRDKTNFTLGTRLPYLFIASRLAHYLKVLQREELGGPRTAPQLQGELSKWISQYVLDQDSAPAGAYARRPLRRAQITVSDVEGSPGWYQVGLKVVPHFKYEGAFFELSLVGKLEQQK